VYRKYHLTKMIRYILFLSIGSFVDTWTASRKYRLRDRTLQEISYTTRHPSGILKDRAITRNQKRGTFLL